MKEELEESEINILEKDIENKTDALKQTEKNSKKKKKQKKYKNQNSGLKSKELEIKEITGIILESYYSKLPFENIISFQLC